MNPSLTGHDLGILVLAFAVLAASGFIAIAMLARQMRLTREDLTTLFNTAMRTAAPHFGDGEIADIFRRALLPVDKRKPCNVCGGSGMILFETEDPPLVKAIRAAFRPPPVATTTTSSAGTNVTENPRSKK